MTWARIDDQFADHPKVKEAGPLAGWLHVCALCYANRYMTDGFVPTVAISTLADWTELGVSCWELVKRLVNAGLWMEAPKGYQIHDFLEYNKSREQILKEREEATERVREFRARKREGNADVTLLHQKCNAVGNAPVTGAPYPIPSPMSSKDNISSKDRESSADKSAKAAPKPSHPAVVVYRQLTGIRPNQAARLLIEEAMPVDGFDESRWKQAITKWSGGRGYNPKSLDGMIEWYREGIPRRVGGNGRKPVIVDEAVSLEPRRSPEEIRADFLAYVKEHEPENYEEELRKCESEAHSGQTKCPDTKNRSSP